MTFAEFPEALSQAILKGKLDPRCMYIENIRHALDATTSEATRLCQEAETGGLLTKTFRYLCPNAACRRVIESSPTALPASQEIACEACEMEAAGGPYVFQAGDLAVMPAYALAVQPAPAP